MLSFLQVYIDQFQREGVFQSCKICGKSLKEAKIESSESLFFRGETYWRRVSQFVSLLIVITFTDGSVPVVLLGHKANVPAALERLRWASFSYSGSAGRRRCPCCQRSVQGRRSKVEEPRWISKAAKTKVLSISKDAILLVESPSTKAHGHSSG